MHEPQQVSPFHFKEKSPSARLVEYVPPPLEAIDAYASAVCQALDNHASTELIRGFATFMKVVVNIKNRSLNQGGQHVA